MSITNIFDCEQRRYFGGYSDFVDGGDGFLYGIPFYACKVFQFNFKDKSIKEIGPDLGRGTRKYESGVLAANGSIYCIPRCTDSAKHILKITPNGGGDAEVAILKDVELPEAGYDLWAPGCLAKDGCIYYMPNEASQILKLDPNDDDRVSLVGEDLGYKMYEAAVAGSDGMIYCLPYLSKQLFKFNPEDNVVSNVGAAFEEDPMFRGGVLATDNNIYAANKYGQILKINTNNNDYELIGYRITEELGDNGWGSAVLGTDQCIYFPPFQFDRVLCFNPISQQVSLVGDSFKDESCTFGGYISWWGGALAKDGFIYFVPYTDHAQILQIDVNQRECRWWHRLLCKASCGKVK